MWSAGMPATRPSRSTASAFPITFIGPWPGHLLPFVPRAAEIDQEKDKRLAMLAKILAECSTIHAAATWLMENEPWDFMAVYYNAVDNFSHGFMRYHPPKMDERIPRSEGIVYQGVGHGLLEFRKKEFDRDVMQFLSRAEG